MEQPILSDPSQCPSESIIFKQIGKTKPLWTSLFEYIHSNHPDFAEEWRYYRDGKSWLLKVTQKKKTIFWLSVIEGAFRTTFYFTDRVEQSIMSAHLSDGVKDQFKNGKRYGKLIGVTVTYKTKKNIQDAKILLRIKTSVTTGFLQ